MGGGRFYGMVGPLLRKAPVNRNVRRSFRAHDRKISDDLHSYVKDAWLDPSSYSLDATTGIVTIPSGKDDWIAGIADQGYFSSETG